jgi:hypothetical protein
MVLEMQKLARIHLMVFAVLLARQQVHLILSSVELGLVYSIALGLVCLASLERLGCLKPYHSSQLGWLVWVLMVFEVLPEHQVLVNSVLQVHPKYLGLPLILAH